MAGALIEAAVPPPAPKQALSFLQQVDKFPPTCRLVSSNMSIALASSDGYPDDVPDPADFAASVEHLVKLGLLDRRPTIEWICRRLKMSKRTLQRRLSASEQSFEYIKRRVLVAQAAALLKMPELLVSEIAYELGYSDPAHFTRAASKWVGETPRAWRRRMIEIT